MSSHIVAHPHDLVVLTDTNPFYLRRLAQRFAARAEVNTERLLLPDPAAPDRFSIQARHGRGP